MNYSEFFKNEVQKIILREFKSIFESDCENTLRGTQNTEAIQTLTIIIDPLSTVSNCNIRTNQTITISPSSKYCLDIPKALSFMNNIDRNNLINKVINNLKIHLQSKLTNRNEFINQLCEKVKKNLNILNYVNDIKESNNIKNNLETDFNLLGYKNDSSRNSNAENSPINTSNISESVMNQINSKMSELENKSRLLSEADINIKLYENITQSCSQDIYIEQNQKLVIKGNVDCKGKDFITMTQNIMIDSQMECYIKPLLKDIENDLKLQRLYNRGDRGCLYYKEYDKCINNKRKVIYKKLDSSQQNCNIPLEEYEDCIIPKCTISNWSDWSVCNYNEKEISTKNRYRKFIKKGEDCNYVMKEIENCNIPERDTGNNKIKLNALKYDLYDTYRGVLNVNTYIIYGLLLLILILFII